MIMEYEKDIYFLKNWYFTTRDYKEKMMWIAHGSSYNNRKFKDGLKIHTSVISKIIIGDTYLEVYTKNSMYRCLFDDSIEESFKFMDNSSLFDESVSKGDLDNLKDKIRNVLKIRKKHYEEKICESIHDEKECLIMVFSDLEDYYFKNFIVKINDKMVYYYMFAHIGMIQDSILIFYDTCESREDAENIDFSYFPYKGNRILFYGWDGYSGKIFAINQGEKELEIDTPYGKFLLQPNNNAYLISEDASEGRITESIAPAVDLYGAWNANVDENGYML